MENEMKIYFVTVSRCHCCWCPLRWLQNYFNWWLLPGYRFPWHWTHQREGDKQSWCHCPFNWGEKEEMWNLLIYINVLPITGQGHGRRTWSPPRIGLQTSHGIEKSRLGTLSTQWLSFRGVDLHIAVLSMPYAKTKLALYLSPSFFKL